MVVPDTNSIKFGVFFSLSRNTVQYGILPALTRHFVLQRIQSRRSKYKQRLTDSLAILKTVLIAKHPRIRPGVFPAFTSLVLAECSTSG
jgi:hypothetical protein